MKDDAFLTREQIFAISFLGVIGNIVYIHTWIDDATDRSAWLASMVGILLIIPLAIWILYLGKYYRAGSILDIIEVSIGKLPNLIICLIYCLINIVIAATHINMFTQLLNTFFLQYTPPWIIMADITAMAVLFANSKIKTIARLFEVLAVLGVINYFVTFIFIFPKNFHPEYVFPVFDTTIAGFIKGIIFIAGNAAECLLIFITFVRFIPSPEKHYKWIVRGILTGAVVFSVAIFLIIAIMSPELAKRIAFGGVNAARIIQLGKYWQGLEVFILAAYQLIAIGKVTVCLYCAWMSLKRIFNNKIPFILLLITSVMIFVPSVYMSSYSSAYSSAVFAANYITLPFTIFVIIFASICVKLNKKKLKVFQND